MLCLTRLAETNEWGPLVIELLRLSFPQISREYPMICLEHRLRSPALKDRVWQRWQFYWSLQTIKTDHH